MFTSSNLQERVRQRPFLPFRIITSAGDRYDIHHPDLVMVGKNLLVVGTASADNPTIFDNVSQISILHVTALENLTAPPKAPGNGQSV